MSSHPEAEEPHRRREPAALLDALARDPRTAVLTAVLAAVATLAALASEWQVTRLDMAAFSGRETDSQTDVRTLTSGIGDVGGLGAGYLTGLFLLAAALLLTLSGPAPGRRYTRPAGLAVGGVLLGVLAAIRMTMGGQSLAVPRFYAVVAADDQLTTTAGRGLWCAVAGVAAAMLALYLADRRTAGVEFRLRRPRPEPDPRPDEPLDLSVGPAVPFGGPLDRDDRAAGGDIGMNPGPGRR